MRRTLVAGAIAVMSCPAWAADPFPVALGGPFTLHDAATGAVRTEIDPDGLHRILYFGYATCPDMCQTTLPHVADIVDALAGQGVRVRPVMITVDPENDRGPEMAAALTGFHPDFVGLTGRKRALARAYRSFGIEKQLIFVDPGGHPVYAHTGHLFLLAPDGRVETILPPVLPVEQTARIVARYVIGDS